VCTTTTGAYNAIKLPNEILEGAEKPANKTSFFNRKPMRACTDCLEEIWWHNKKKNSLVSRQKALQKNYVCKSGTYPIKNEN
jgi:hypothetical protein